MILDYTLIIYRANTSIAKEEALSIQNKLKPYESDVLILEAEDNSLSQIIKNQKKIPNLIIVLGGDGTVLKAAKYFAPLKIPILSFNVGGNLGLLTHDENLLSIDNLWLRISKDHFAIEQRMMLSAYIEKKDGLTTKSCWALNDFYIRAYGDHLSPTCTLELEIDGETVDRYRGDGLILATPTGSTAYAMASGGPILHPGIEAIIVSAICPMSLSSRPIIVPSASRLVLKPLKGPMKQVKLWQDGAGSFLLEEGDKCVIKRANQNALMVVLDQSPSYYRTLTHKLHWEGSINGLKVSSE